MNLARAISERTPFVSGDLMRISTIVGLARLGSSVQEKLAGLRAPTAIAVP